MVELAKYQQFLCALNVAMEIGLLVSMAARKHYRTHPAFFFYVCMTFLQAVVAFIVYSTWGFSSSFTQRFAWATQGIVICARALAVAELCRHLLGQFRGIWALAWRILLFCGATVALYSALIAGWRWDRTVLQIDRGLELSIVFVIVALFLFARYYEVVAEPAVRTLGIGFFLLSSFNVVNDTILQRRLAQYGDFWWLLGLLAFLSSVSLWISAFRKPLPSSEPHPALLPGDIYQALVPGLNARLCLLNEDLGQFWNVKERRS